MAQYFIKRKDSINGPITGKKILALIKADKVFESDLIGSSNEGPWKTAGTIKSLQPLFLETNKDDDDVLEWLSDNEGTDSQATSAPPANSASDAAATTESAVSTTEPEVPVSEVAETGNWAYQQTKSDLDDSILHTFMAVSSTGTDKYGVPIKLYVRLGNNVADIFIDWEGTCFADAHTSFQHAVSARCGAADMGAYVWAVTNDLTGTILAGTRAYYCIRSFYDVDTAVFSVKPYHENRIEAKFNVAGLENRIRAFPNQFPQLSKLPETSDHGWVSHKWKSPLMRRFGCAWRIVLILVGSAVAYWTLTQGFS